MGLGCAAQRTVLGASISQFVDGRAAPLHRRADDLLRSAAAVSFALLWADGQLIITPELKASSVWLSAIQLLIPMYMFTRACGENGHRRMCLRGRRAGSWKSMASYGHLRSPGRFLASQYRAEAEGAEADMVKRARHRDVCAMHTLMAIDRAPGRSKAGLPQTSPSKADPLK